MPYDKVVKRKDGTLTINKSKPCKAEIRKEMYYLIEKMNELETKVKEGIKAEIELKELEKDFDKLCKLGIEEDEDERD